MYLVAIAWLYVVVMMALAEALSPQGSVLGAFFTLLLYGVLPVVVLVYILGAPHRRRARLAAERAEQAESAARAESAAAAGDDAGGAALREPGDAPVGSRDAAVAPAHALSGPAAPDGSGQAPRDAVAPVRKEA